MNLTTNSTKGIKRKKKKTSNFPNVQSVEHSLKKLDYIADKTLSTTLFLSSQLQKPLFLEGEAGVGKTELAKVLAASLDTELIRLQCYEGLDSNSALYEWNYAKQLLHIKMEEGQENSSSQKVERDIFSQDYLIERPLLRALIKSKEKPVVLLIDEIDRSDEEFEAFLLEILSDFQITIPEMGTIKAENKPLVILTSNRTREIHDALKRRCLYLWVDYPSFDKEVEIISTKVPEISTSLAEQITRFMGQARQMDFYKRPGVAETLDWAQALLALEKTQLDEIAVTETIGCILKYQDDIKRINEEEGGLERMVSLSQSSSDS
ncbi:MAG: MoxR family ATPase [Nitrospinota bacterium]|nr:MoxR family ATPase [Nitrospinota bacterium]